MFYGELTMRENNNLSAAKNAKNDEFYTQYSDIQKEVNAYLEYDPDVFRGKTILCPCDDPEWSNFTKFFAQNFENFGIKKLISTSYAVESKKAVKDYQLTLFETSSPQYDADKTRIKGKIFTLTRDSNQSGYIDIDDLQWQYLEGDGDFRSAEVTALRDEADIIVTNPPFSLFREFLNWIIAGNNHFLIIGNINCISYREVFLQIKENKAWLGNGMGRWISGFIVPSSYEYTFSLDVPRISSCSSFDNLSNKLVEVIETTRTSNPLCSKILAISTARLTSLPVAINVLST